MLKALTRKELFELAPVAALALLAQFYLMTVGAGLPIGPRLVAGNRIPFLNDSLVTWLMLAGGSAGILIGFWQTVGESVRGTWQYLLHRAATRGSILGTKLLTGASVTLLVTGVPLMVYAAWAATPGTHASPFQWRFTLDAWTQVLQVPIAYLAAFLSGLRPARWFGSRLLPLACGLGLLFILQAFDQWGWLMVAPTLAIEAVLLSVIFHEGANRDFS
jgi:hypothetical protein